MLVNMISQMAQDTEKGHAQDTRKGHISHGLYVIFTHVYAFFFFFFFLHSHLHKLPHLYRPKHTSDRSEEVPAETMNLVQLLNALKGS